MAWVEKITADKGQAAVSRFIESLQRSATQLRNGPGIPTVPPFVPTEVFLTPSERNQALVLFEDLDDDGSGFIERQEAPPPLLLGKGWQAQALSLIPNPGVR